MKLKEKWYEFVCVFSCNQKCEMVFGTCVTMASPHALKFIDQLGTDFLFIDMEHIPQDREKVAWMCHAFAGKDQVPLVRIPYPDEYEASKVLDGGADHYCHLCSP